MSKKDNKKMYFSRYLKTSKALNLIGWYGIYLLIIIIGIYWIINKDYNPVKTPTKQRTIQDAAKGKKAISSSNSKYLITTVAGTGEAGYSGDNGIATDAKINIPYGIEVSENGTFYIADRYNNRIRKVDPSGIISTFAGNGSSQIICTNEPAQTAHIPLPEKIDLGKDGSLYISSSVDHRIRKIDTQGLVRAVAGTGDPGYNIDGIIATSSQINAPGGIAVDSAGNLYIADMLNHRIRKVDQKGVIATIAGTGTPGYSGDNGTAKRAQIDSPNSIVVTSDGSLYFTHGVHPRIRKISPQGEITTIAGTGVSGFSDDGADATKAQLSDWLSVAVGPDDILYIVDHNNHRILYIDDKGFIRTIAGTGVQGFSGDNGIATQAKLAHPTSISITQDNLLYVADADNNRIRKLIPIESSKPY